MRARLLIALPLIAMSMLAGRAASAQTVANGPYYATPSWDQTMPVATRFIVLSNFNNDAVLDRETGLVWMKTWPSGTVMYDRATLDCAINATGGRGGWRLPSLHEFMSLTDPTSTQGFPVGHPFLNVSPNGYWTTTLFPQGATIYFAPFPSSLKDGFPTIAPTVPANWVCVRGSTR